MSQVSNTSNEIDLLKSLLPDPFLEDIGDLETAIEDSELTEREYLSFVLAEVSDKTGKESAELMNIEPGTFWGKLGRARNKIEAAETTIELAQV